MDTTLLRTLRRHPLTGALNADELRYLTDRGRVLGHLPGTYVFHESQPRRAFGVILKGRLELRTGQRGRPTVLAVLGPGESYGEGSLLDVLRAGAGEGMAQPGGARSHLLARCHDPPAGDAIPIAGARLRRVTPAGILGRSSGSTLGAPLRSEA